MREENIKRNSRKKLNALILLVAFTAILLIVSTYAWFSTQRNVTLGGLEGRVNVAEGLQISLDALNWANEIDLSNNAIEYFRQTNADLGLTDPDQMRSLAKPYAGRTNLVPSELLPVSTTAQTGEGIGLSDFNMYRGEIEGGKKLNTIAKLVADSNAGYYAIDFFLQNSSAQTSIDGNIADILQLEGNSAIVLNDTTKESTGLQNTLRVAFAIYDEDPDLEDNTLVSKTPTQDQILAATTGDARTISDVAIWEPNASGAQEGDISTAITKYAAHVNYILQNNNKVTFSNADRTEFTIPATNRFTADSAIPTYALTGASVTKGTIDDIYNWDTGATANGLKRQYTNQTSNRGIGADPIQLQSAEDGTSDFSVAPGKYIHMRMYVWLEGQDVDCINYASLGGALTIDVGLSKPGSATDEVGGN